MCSERRLANQRQDIPTNYHAPLMYVVFTTQRYITSINTGLGTGLLDIPIIHLPLSQLNLQPSSFPDSQLLATPRASRNIIMSCASSSVALPVIVSEDIAAVIGGNDMSKNWLELTPIRVDGTQIDVKFKDLITIGQENEFSDKVRAYISEPFRGSRLTLETIEVLRSTVVEGGVSQDIQITGFTLYFSATPVGSSTHCGS